MPASTGEHRAPPAFNNGIGNVDDKNDQPDDFFEEVDLSQEWKNNPSGGFYDNSHAVAFAPSTVPQHGQHSSQKHPPQQHAHQQPPQQAAVHRAAPPATTGGPPRGSTSHMSVPAPIQTGPPASMWGGAAPSAHTSGAHVNSSPAPQTQPHTASSSSGAHHQQASSGGTPSASIPPSSSTGSFFGFGASSSTSSPVPAAASAPSGASAHTPKAATATTASAAKTDDGEGRGGLFGAVRKGMLKYLYPDAHDASSNIGKSLEAVYNKETGRWEFPGEVSTITTFLFAAYFLSTALLAFSFLALLLASLPNLCVHQISVVPLTGGERNTQSSITATTNGANGRRQRGQQRRQQPRC